MGNVFLIFSYFFQDIIINPWQDADGVEDFLYYCCPECDFKHEVKEMFKQHALEEHPRSEALFFEDREVAKNAAADLINSQIKSNSPSLGVDALDEALYSASQGKDDDDDDNTVS